MQEFLIHIVDTINTYLSDYVLVFMLLAIGLFYTIKTRFIQVRCFGEGMRRVFGNLSLRGGKQESGMSSFQALATAIAAQVGTGNIVGASAAILTGGPGAIFWMWIIAFFGMATIYAEASLALQTREVEKDGTVHGGPVYYISRAFHGKFGKFLATFFAVTAVLSLGFMGNLVQANAIGSTMQTAFGIPAWVMGVILVVICGIIFLGGVERLASVTEKIVPVMAGLFLLGGLGVLICRLPHLPQTFGMIFKYAFMPQAIIGGGVGAALKIAVSQGAKRGLFSNEAGMGSTPHAHAQANVQTPHEQGVVAMVGVFIDTFVVLTLNALVIISTLYTPDGILASGVIPAGIDSGNLAQTAFGTVMGTKLGSMFVAVCLLFFALSTILSWNLFAKVNVHWLKPNGSKRVLTVFSIIALVFVFLGTVASNKLVWGLTDLFNNLMVIPNGLALFALSSMVVKHSKDPLPERIKQ